MKIIIIGDGKVGHALARQLAQEGHDICIVDLRQDVLENTLNSLDVNGIHGSGTDIQILKKAGIARTDLLIAATSADEVNLVCCLLAKKLGASNTIARVRSPEYYRSSYLVKDDLGLSMVINPEFAAAGEIVRKLRFSTRISVSSFAKGRMEMARFTVDAGSVLDGLSVQEAASKLKSEVLFCIVERGREVHIPTGTSVLRAGDKVSVTGSFRDLERFFGEIGIYPKRRLREVMVVGASRITWYLVPALLKMGIDVRIVEINPVKAEKLAAAFPEATIICGDGTDQNLLLSENLEDMDGFVSLTDNDEENVIVSMFANSKGVNAVIPKVNRVELGFLLEQLGLSSGITPKNIAADQIVQYVRAMQNSVGSSVESIIRAADDRVEVLEFRVRSNCHFIGRPMRHLRLKPGVLVAYITHKGRPSIARGDSRVALGDTFIVVSRQKGLRDINDVLAGA